MIPKEARAKLGQMMKERSKKDQPRGMVKLMTHGLKIKGSLSSHDVKNGLHKRIKGIRRCYTDLLSRDPKARGKVRLGFAIEPDGKVGKVRIEQQTVKLDKMCLTKALKQGRFAKPKGTTEVSVPFIFASMR